MNRRNDPAGAACLAARQLALFPTSQSYGPYGLAVNQPEPDLHQVEAEPLVTAEDVARWPDWTELPVTALDLDGFDDDGCLTEGGAE